MDLSKIDYWKLIHILIGGLTYLVGVFFLEMLVRLVADWIFRTTAIYGVLAYEEAQNAYYIIRLGTIYLPSGFFGGLYTGYKIKEKLKLIMMFPSITGFLLVLIIQYFLGYMTLIISASLLNLAKIIAIPFIVSLSGSYLGGYTINWQVEEVVEEKISLLFEEVKES